MRKTLLSTLVAAGLAVTGAANAGLVFDFDGTGAGGEVYLNSFEFGATSFLAKGGNQAIANAMMDYAQDGVVNGVYTFDVYTHARVIGYKDALTNQDVGLASATDEITLVTKFTEQITGIGFIGGFGFATFASTGSGWLEMYYGSTKNGTDLTGSGFNDGTLILRATGAGAPGASTGNFNTNNNAAVVLDQYGGVNNYISTNLVNQQKTVTGGGDQGAVTVGTGTGATMALNYDFFKTDLLDFSMALSNFSLDLPFVSSDPSDCFTLNQSTAAIGGTNSGGCIASHAQNWYAAQPNNGGYAPRPGAINGHLTASGVSSPVPLLAAQGVKTTYTPDGVDFVASTRFTSQVAGTAFVRVPEPATLALLGIGLMGFGFSLARRRG